MGVSKNTEERGQKWMSRQGKTLMPFGGIFYVPLFHFLLNLVDFTSDIEFEIYLVPYFHDFLTVQFIKEQRALKCTRNSHAECKVLNFLYLKELSQKEEKI